MQPCIITNDIMDICDIRRNMKKTKNSTPKTVEQYSTVNHTIRTAMIKTKEEWISQQCDNIEKGIKQSNSEKAFDTLKKLTRKQQHKATVIEDRNGSLLTDNADVLTRWTEYCQELYNYELKPYTSILKSKTSSVDETDDVQVMKEEVEEALRTLKGGKSPGVDRAEQSCSNTAALK